jgi:DNA-binding winged helix-turn-helix (wHTH) protein/predicted ATPase
MIVYTFGSFSLFPANFILSANGTAHQLTPRLLAVLQYLLNHRERVVTKEELIAEVWQGSFIEEENVSRTVSTLRALLGDAAEHPKYIKTVRRVGYRFIHPVNYQMASSLQNARHHGSWSHDRNVLVGRRRERSFLKELATNCERGKGAIVCISGEAGLGKTALVEGLLCDMRGSAIIARSRCAPSVSTAETYAPVIDIFKNLFHSCPADLQRRLKELAPAWSFEALRGSVTENAASQPLGAVSSMHRQFGDVLVELSRKQPLILFIDDFHWADAKTVDLLAYVSLHISHAHLLLILAVRSRGLVQSGHPFRQLSQELQVKGACLQLPLQPLSVEEVREYLDMSAHVESGKDRLAQHIYMHSEGNPLFMVSVLAFLKETGNLRECNGAWQVHGKLDDLELSIPSGLDGFLRLNLEQLDPVDRLLICIASMQGMEFDSAILSEVSAMPAIEVEERLDGLVRVHELVRYMGPIPLSDGTDTECYQFMHALLWKTCQDSISPSRRKSISQKIAASIGRRTSRN